MIMKKTNPVQWLLMVAFLLGGSSAALAEEPSKTGTTSSQDTQQIQEQKKKQKEKQKKKQKKEQKKVTDPGQQAQKKKVETQFVDRNGDGIQDGKEHRFRGRHRRRHGQTGVDEEGRRGEARHRSKGTSKGRQ